MATVHKRRWKTKAGEKVAWVADWFDRDGKRHIKTFERQRDAKDWLDDTRPKIKTGQHVPDSKAPTVSAASEAWIARGEDDDLESSTIRQRRLHVDRYIEPMLGADTKLSGVDVQALRNELVRICSRAMAKKVMVSLKAIMRQAKMAHLAADVAKIKTGGRHKKRLEVGVDIPTAPEVKALIETTVAAPKAHALACLAGFAGLRASEIRGLAWPRLKLGDKPTVTIQERADETNVLGSPKSDASKRTIGLNETTVKALRAWKVAQPPIVLKDADGNEIKRPRTLVFGTASDRPDGLPNIRRRLLRRAWVQAGVALPVLDEGKPVMQPKYPGLKCLRHFAISSWLKTCNGDFKAVQVRAGHATLALTLDTYGHLLDANDGDQIAAAEKLVLG